MQIESEKKYWNGFNLIQEIGPAAFKKIINFFPSMEQAYKATGSELTQAGLKQQLVQDVLVKRQAINVEQEYEKLEKEKIKIITIRDENYPKLLKEIYSPPAVIYVRGDLKQEELCLAIVGTRQHTLYGTQVTSEIAEALCQAGITVVSGLAKGIDTLAHRACVKNKNRTIAVLGSGIDNKSVYPPMNRGLAKEIESHGAVISEYPIGALPLRQNFPIRNRIISGLCVGVLVVEAPEGSGALITAKYALDQNREVFAIPGPIYSENSRGTNLLIKMGAKAVANIEDIVEELNLTINTIESESANKTEKISADTKEEESILELLGKEPIYIDSIIENSQFSVAEVNSLLTLLEIKGRIRNLGGMNYVLK